MDINALKNKLVKIKDIDIHFCNAGYYYFNFFQHRVYYHFDKDYIIRSSYKQIDNSRKHYMLVVKKYSNEFKLINHSVLFVTNRIEVLLHVNKKGKTQYPPIFSVKNKIPTTKLNFSNYNELITYFLLTR